MVELAVVEKDKFLFGAKAPLILLIINEIQDIS
jgi:hypothetical protein